MLKPSSVFTVVAILLLIVLGVLYQEHENPSIAPSSCGDTWLYHEDISLAKQQKDKELRVLAKHISKEYNTKPKLAANIVQTVYAHTETVEFPTPYLVLAVIAVESSFRKDVRSRTGAIGLMQIMPINNLGETMEDNILAGIWLLQEYRERLGVDEDAVMAYNMGIGNFKRGKHNPQYVEKVLNKELQYRKLIQF